MEVWRRLLRRPQMVMNISKRVFTFLFLIKVWEVFPDEDNPFGSEVPGRMQKGIKVLKGN
jgi:hypothetical protein